jgi:uncharacterized membrane protein
MELFERYDVRPPVAWLVALVAGVATLAVGAILFTRRVYWGFIWRYFLGPVRADGKGQDCVGYIAEDGVVRGSDQLASCDPAALEPEMGTVFIAEPGYTVISTVGYIIVLVFMLAGVYLLLQRFDLTPSRYFFYALVPFVLFGGALRTVEDSFVAAIRAGEAPAFEYPVSALLISPFIYFTVFAVALTAFLASKYLAHRGITDTYYYPLAAAGVGSVTLTVGYLMLLSASVGYVTLFPGVLVVTLGVATLVSVGAYYLVDSRRPVVHAGTGLMGLVVLWGHAIDGVANVVANDWTWIWGLGDYSAKHPLNRLIMDVTGSIQGGDRIFGVHVGEAWPFLLLKILVPVAILAVFDKEFIDESPRYSVMLLIAIVAVGLGPGTRDMLRVAFGI